jgi:hypothetical protein
LPETSTRLKKLVLHAASALLIFGALTSFSLAAWLARAPEPWGWHALVALLSAALGLAAGVALLRAPSRALAGAGASVMLLSLVRVGVPEHFTWPLVVLPLVTLVLTVPVVRAALALKGPVTGKPSF